MQLPKQSRGRKKKMKQKKNSKSFSLTSSNPMGKTKQSLIDRANGRHKQPGDIKEEVVTIIALIGCDHVTGQPTGRLQIRK